MLGLHSTPASAGSTSVFLMGSVGAAGTPDAALANPVRMKETNMGNLFCDSLIWYVKVRVQGDDVEAGHVIGT